MNLLHLLRRFTKHAIEYLMSQIHRFLDRLSRRHNPYVHLSLPGKPDPGHEACAEIDHSPIDARQMSIWIKHQIALVRLWRLAS